MRKFISALAFVMLFAVMLTACSKSDVKEVELDTSAREMELVLGERITLPQPIDGDAVNLEILYQDGSVYVPSHRYSLSADFTAHFEGKYYAIYTLTAENGETAKTVLTLNVKGEALGEGISIDGVLDEAVYSAGYRTGVDGNMLFKYHFAENGILIGVKVSDTQLVYNDYLVSRFSQSDGFEVCFNFSGETGDRLNASCRKIRFGMNGEVYVYEPTEAKSYYELNEAKTALLMQAVRIHGTKSAVGSDDITEIDTDTGYVVEAFLSYKMLGVEAPSGDIGVAFTHRDITAVSAALAMQNGGGNRYFCSVELPEGVQTVLFDNGESYTYSSYDVLAFTEKYIRLSQTDGFEE